MPPVAVGLPPIVTVEPPQMVNVLEPPPPAFADGRESTGIV